MVADQREGFADQLLVDIRSINLGRIEEGDALLVSGPDNIDAMSFVRSRSIVGAEAHAAKANFRDFKCAKLSCFHNVSAFPTPFASRNGFSFQTSLAVVQ